MLRKAWVEGKDGSALRGFLPITAALMWLSASQAQDASPPGEPDPLFDRPLAHFMTVDQTIRLQGVVSERRFFVPLSPRIALDEASLHLRLTHSTSVLEQLSRVLVLLNNRTIAQIPMIISKPEIDAEIPLPIELLKRDYNELKLRAIQHYTEKCERPEAPELWAEIDTMQSRVVLGGSLRPVDSDLGSLDDVLDERLWAAPDLTIVTANDLDDETLASGAIVAQAVALRYRYHPLQIHHASASPARETVQTGVLPGLDQAKLGEGDAVLIGVRETLAPYLAPQILAEIRGAYVAAFPQDTDPTRLVLVVSGTSPHEVRTAAEALALGRGRPHPAAAASSIAAVEAPELDWYAAANSVHPDTEYRFSDLGFRDYASTGEPMDLEFLIPPDLFAREQARIRLELNFAYSAGLRSDAALEIMINGLFTRSIRFVEPGGQSFQGYVVDIPLKSFRPGRNVVTFLPSLQSLFSGECESQPIGRVAIYADSKLIMPEAVHLTSLPDLSRFRESLFPFGVAPDGSRLAIQVTSRDAFSTAAAWTLLGKLAQVQKYPLLESVVSYGTVPDERHVMVIGPVQSLPQNLLEAAAVQLTDPASIPTEVALREPPPKADGVVLGRRLPDAGTPQVPPHVARVRQPLALGDWAALEAFRRPDSDDTAMLLTAAEPVLLAARTRTLIGHDVWGSLQGDTVFWREDKSSVIARRLGSTWLVGDVDAIEQLEYFFSKYPWWWVVLVLAALVPVAFIIRMMVLRRRRHEYGESDDREF